MKLIKVLHEAKIVLQPEQFEKGSWLAKDKKSVFVPYKNKAYELDVYFKVEADGVGLKIREYEALGGAMIERYKKFTASDPKEAMKLMRAEFKQRIAHAKESKDRSDQIKFRER